MSDPNLSDLNKIIESAQRLGVEIDEGMAHQGPELALQLVQNLPAQLGSHVVEIGEHADLERVLATGSQRLDGFELLGESLE